MPSIYNLSRFFWDFAFENPGKIKPIHTAIYFFALEHCNRLGWKVNFGLPTSMVLEAISVKSYSVYKSAFDDLVTFGMIEVIEYSKNQYSSNVIALKENYKANTKAKFKALDSALVKHTSKQGQSEVSIDIPVYNYTIKQETRDSLFSDELYMTDIRRNNPGKDLDDAWEQCWTYFSQLPTPLLEWEWRQKFSSWLIRYTPKKNGKDSNGKTKLVQ